MVEFQVGGHSYRSNKLSALTQFHVCRRLVPALSDLAPLMKATLASKRAADEKGEEWKFDGWAALDPLSKALTTISDDDANYVIFACLEVTERNEKGVWSRLRTPQGLMMFNDLEMPELVMIVWNVLAGHLESFFSTLPQTSDATT